MIAFLRLTIRRLALGWLAAAAIVMPPGGQADDWLIAESERAALPGFVLQQYGGGAVDLAAYRGQVVLVNFWATWCQSCVAEFPSLMRLKAKLAGRRFEILAVNLGESDAAIAGFVESLQTATTDGINFPLLLDRPAITTAVRWPVRLLPTTMLLDQHGRLAAKMVGQRVWDGDASLALVRGLLAEADAKVDIGQ